MDAVAGSLTNTAGAKNMLEACLALCESIIGLHHPDTLSVKTNLANRCRDDDDYDRAEALHTECWQVCLESLGDHHPDTIDSLENVALCALDKTDYVRARALYDQALQFRRQVHGEKVRYFDPIYVPLCSSCFCAAPSHSLLSAFCGRRFVRVRRFWGVCCFSYFSLLL